MATAYAWMANDVVYGVGHTPTEAREDAREWMRGESYGTPPLDEGEAHPITAAQMKHIIMGKTGAR